MSAQQWENLFTQWATGPGQTEQDRCDNAVRMVKAAITEYVPLKNRSITVFAQGSYRNRTNVRQDSDVDVCVFCSDTCYHETFHAPEVLEEINHLGPATYAFAQYKREIEGALVAKFGRNAVTRGDKAFDVHESSYRVAADVVAAFECKSYIHDWQGKTTYRKGTVIQSEKSGRIIYNWPEQHYDNGVSKHTATNRQFKKKVRILKRLRYKLESEGFEVGATTSSFLIESMVFNCNNTSFSSFRHYDSIRAILVDIWELLKKESEELAMVEVNDIKYLFHSSQAWSLEDARKCVLAMWQYIGFD